MAAGSKIICDNGRRHEDLVRVFDFVGLDFDDDTLVATDIAAASQLQDELIAFGSDG